MTRTGAEPREKDIRNLQNLHESSASIQAWRIGCHTCIPCGDSVHRWIVLPLLSASLTAPVPHPHISSFHSIPCSLVLFIVSFLPCSCCLHSHPMPHPSASNGLSLRPSPGPAGPWSAEHRQPISIATHGWTPSTKEQRGRPARTRLPIAHSEGWGGDQLIRC